MNIWMSVFIVFCIFVFWWVLSYVLMTVEDLWSVVILFAFGVLDIILLVTALKMSTVGGEVIKEETYYVSSYYGVNEDYDGKILVQEEDGTPHELYSDETKIRLTDGKSYVKITTERAKVLCFYTDNEKTELYISKGE